MVNDKNFLNQYSKATALPSLYIHITQSCGNTEYTFCSKPSHSEQRYSENVNLKTSF